MPHGSYELVHPIAGPLVGKAQDAGAPYITLLDLTTDLRCSPLPDPSGGAPERLPLALGNGPSSPTSSAILGSCDAR